MHHAKIMLHPFRHPLRLIGTVIDMHGGPLFSPGLAILGWDKLSIERGAFAPENLVSFHACQPRF